MLRIVPSVLSTIPCAAVTASCLLHIASAAPDRRFAGRWEGGPTFTFPTALMIYLCEAGLGVSS